MRKEGSFTTCSQCLATRSMISPARVHDVPTMPMHEVLAKELRDPARVSFKIEEARENGTLLRAYWDHPVAKASSTPVLPVAIFMDGIACSHTDSVLGVWAINMISHKRHVVASQLPLMTLLRWSLKRMPCLTTSLRSSSDVKVDVPTLSLSSSRPNKFAMYSAVSFGQGRY